MPLTDRCYHSYASALEAIDYREPNALQAVDEHTDAFRDEVQRLNAWAWDAARKHIDRDVEQLLASMGSEDDEVISERCADIIEHTIEDQTKKLIAAVAACRQAKLDIIDRGSA